jgi:hypothetical protein
MKAKMQEKVKKMGCRTIGRIGRYQGITQCILLGLKRAYIRGEADFLVFIYMGGGSAFIQIETLTDEDLKSRRQISSTIFFVSSCAMKSLQMKIEKYERVKSKESIF